MIVNSSVAIDNVIHYNNELSLLVYRACRTIEKEARKKKSRAYVTVDPADYYMINDVVTFLSDELGYRVIVSDYNVLLICWSMRVIHCVERDDYLTAIAAYNIANAASKTYGNICAKINECILDASRKGKSYCNYNIGDVPASAVEEIIESLWSAKYDVEFDGSNFAIRWC